MIRLDSFNFLLTALLGLGMIAPNNVATEYSILDGAYYQRTQKPPRQFQVVGRFQGRSPADLAHGMADLAAFLDRDLVGTDQPLLLQLTPMNEAGEAIGDTAQLPAVYSGGMDGQYDNHYAETVPISFTAYLPYLSGGDAGAALTVQQSITNANSILRRQSDGSWSALGTGISGGAQTVLAFATTNDGSLYAGGGFTDAGGSGADNLAKWDGSVWSVVGSATALNAAVRALAVGPTGILYVGGDFTNANGIAAADYIAQWNGSSWSALGTGMAAGISTGVYAIAISPSGAVYAAGDFTTAGGVGANNIAVWNGSVWAPLGTGTNNRIHAMVFGPDGRLYIGGVFTTAGGVTVNFVAVWNGSTWASLGGGLNGAVLTLAVGPDGRLYAGGVFTASTAGVTLNRVAVWNGVSWQPLGSGVDNQVNALTFDARGILYAGGMFTVAGGFPTADRIAAWTGSAWVGGDVMLPSTPIVGALKRVPNGTLYVGFTTNGTAQAAGVTSVVNDSPQQVYPVLTIKGPSSGTSRIYEIINATTGAAIYLNYTINAGETATSIFDPLTPTFFSDFQGDLSSKILPGSQPSRFFLIPKTKTTPGANSIVFFSAVSSVTATLSWPKRYNTLRDLVQ